MSSMLWYTEIVESAEKPEHQQLFKRGDWTFATNNYVIVAMRDAVNVAAPVCADASLTRKITSFEGGERVAVMRINLEFLKLVVDVLSDDYAQLEIRRDEKNGYLYLAIGNEMEYALVAGSIDHNGRTDAEIERPWMNEPVKEK